MIETIKVISDAQPKCPTCGSSGKTIVKHGLSHNVYEIVQRYECKKCGTDFRAGHSDAPFRFHYPRRIIQFACLEIEKGLSFRRVRAEIKKQTEISVSTTTIYNWVKKFTNYKQKRQAVRRKVIDAILENVNIIDLSNATGVKYNSVKNVIRALKSTKPSTLQTEYVKRYRLLAQKHGYLKRNCERLQQEAKRLQDEVEQLGSELKR